MLYMSELMQNASANVMNISLISDVLLHQLLLDTQGQMGLWLGERVGGLREGWPITDTKYMLSRGVVLLMLPRSCPWARLFPLMNSREYPLYIWVDPGGHSGIRMSWLCLVNRKLSFFTMAVQEPGWPGAPLAPVWPRGPVIPVDTVEWGDYCLSEPFHCIKTWAITTVTTNNKMSNPLKATI